MWRLCCALRDPAAPPPRPAAASLRYGLPALILSGGSSEVERQHDACLLRAGDPHGPVVALHIDADRAELRETVAGAPWRILGSAALRDADAEPLRRIRPRSINDTRAVVLAADALYDVHLDPFIAVHRRVDFSRAAVNATCVDMWGSDGALVGFSCGDVCVVDLRDPTAGPMLHAAVPCPPGPAVGPLRPIGALRTLGALMDPAAGQRGAGVLSCCAVDDGFRVVCGIGDARGTVVVADLRRAANAAPGAERKRTRAGGRAAGLSDTAAAAQAVVAGAFSTPTGYPACDMRCVRGAVGMVDTGGTALLTSVAALETCGIGAHALNRAHTNRRTHSHSHSRALRCDLTEDGRVLASTRVGPWAAALTIGGAGRPEVSVDVAVTPPPGCEAESFASVSCFGDFVCAQTVRGNAVCFTACDAGGIAEPPLPAMRW